MQRHWRLEQVISPIVNNLGYTFVGLEYSPQGKRSVIRIYIDKQGGVTAGDCERVSRQVNAVLSVEGVVSEDYLLEVSSPGLDRLLFTPAQFAEQIGKLVSIRLIASLQGRKNYKGRIQAVQGDQITILVEENEITFSFPEIDRARIVPEW